MIISVLVRRLSEGKDYADFRAAWLPDKGFGVPTRVVSGISMEDPREVITIGFTDLDEAAADAFLAKIGTQEQSRHDRLDDVIEPGGPEPSTSRLPTTTSPMSHPRNSSWLHATELPRPSESDCKTPGRILVRATRSGQHRADRHSGRVCRGDWADETQA